MKYFLVLNFLVIAQLQPFGQNAFYEVLDPSTSTDKSGTMVQSPLMTPQTTMSTKLVDGLTKFYAAEFKKARTMAYLGKLEAIIKKFPEIELIFPKTLEKLKKMDPASFPQLGSEFKEVFDYDLSNALGVLVEHIENEKAELDGAKVLTPIVCKAIRESERFVLIKLMMELHDRLFHNVHPVEVFEIIDNVVSKMEGVEEDLKNAVRIANLVQRNLQNKLLWTEQEFSNVWVSLNEFSSLDKSKFTAFVELLKDQAEANEIAIVHGQFDQEVRSFLALLLELNTVRENLKENGFDKLYIDYAMLFGKAITHFWSASEEKKISEMMNRLAVIYRQTGQKEYGNLLGEVSELLLALYNGAETKEFFTLLQTLDGHVRFMAAIIEADNSDMVADAISTYALNRTNFIHKRERSFTLSITGHPGYFFGGEQFRFDSGVSKDSLSGHTHGLTAPVGLEASMSLKKSNTRSCGSLSLFFQLLDLGAILNYRLGDEVSPLPDVVRLSQVYSPGVSLQYGFRNSPFTIGVGYQRSPGLRVVNLENGFTELPSADRLFIRASFDIPTVGIYKSRF